MRRLACLCTAALLLLLGALPSGACDGSQQVAACSCGCGGTPRPYCAYRDCVCARTGAASEAQARQLTAPCSCGCGGTPRPYCAHKGCVCAQTTMAGRPGPLFRDPTGGDTSLAACSCGCGGTPRPYCAYRDCVCARGGAAPQAQARRLTVSCSCGCGGTPRPYCAHKGCPCAQTSLAGGPAAPFQEMAAGPLAGSCTCGCGGTPRPYCAYRDCVCARAGLADPAAADQAARGCSCGCGGTPRPYCAHRGCPCAQTSLGQGPASAFRDPAAGAASLAACSCGCGGTPRPYCAHRDCICAQTGAAPEAQARPLTATCSCGCGGTPRPYCAHRNCPCAGLSVAGRPAPPFAADPGSLEVVALADLAGSAVRLIGDGGTTSHTYLQLSNPGSRPVTVKIPAYTQFSPQDPSAQALTTVRDGLATVPAGQTVEVRLETVCSGRRSQPPPGPQGGLFRLTQPPPYVLSIVETSLRLAEQGAYDQVPMPRCKALETVRQMALWYEAAQGSPSPADQVTPQTIAEQVYRQLGKAPEELTPREREQVEQGSQNLFEAVDLTVKTSRQGAPSTCTCRPRG